MNAAFAFSLETFYFSVMLFLLSVNVIKGRVKYSVLHGDGGHYQLEKKIKAHQNFIEYVPLVLISHLGLLLLKAPVFTIIIPAIIFIIARTSHAISLLYIEIKSVTREKKPNLSYRALGMILTFLALILSASFLVIYSL